MWGVGNLDGGDDVRQDDVHEDGQAGGPQACLQLRKSMVVDMQTDGSNPGIGTAQDRQVRHGVRNREHEGQEVVHSGDGGGQGGEARAGGAVQHQHQRQVRQGGRHQVPKGLVQLRIGEFVDKFSKVGGGGQLSKSVSDEKIRILAGKRRDTGAKGSPAKRTKLEQK